MKAEGRSGYYLTRPQHYLDFASQNMGTEILLLLSFLSYNFFHWNPDVLSFLSSLVLNHLSFSCSEFKPFCLFVRPFHVFHSFTFVAGILHLDWALLTQPLPRMVSGGGCWIDAGVVITSSACKPQNYATIEILTKHSRALLPCPSVVSEDCASSGGEGLVL